MVAIPALLRRTATYSSSTCSLISSPISPKLRQKQNNTPKKRRKAHQKELNTIGTGMRTSPKASYALSLSRCTCSRLLTSVGTTSTFFSPTRAAISRPRICAFSASISARTTLSPCLNGGANPPVSHFNHSITQSIRDPTKGGRGGRWNKDERATHRANSSAAARPIPDAAPVTTATRPHWKAGCPAGSKGERICVKYRIAAAVARKRTRSGRSDRGMREGLGRLCWVPAAPSRPLYRSALLGTAKRDGSGT